MNVLEIPTLPSSSHEVDPTLLHIHLHEVCQQIVQLFAFTWLLESWGCSNCSLFMSFVIFLSVYSCNISGLALEAKSAWSFHASKFVVCSTKSLQKINSIPSIHFHLSSYQIFCSMEFMYKIIQHYFFNHENANQLPPPCAFALVH
jgi:hypothetical protein